MIKIKSVKTPTSRDSSISIRGIIRSTLNIVFLQMLVYGLVKATKYYNKNILKKLGYT